MNGPVLVTGSGGFIGRAVVARLAEAGIPVRAGLRQARVTTRGIDTVACDLDRPAELDAACAGADVIVHAAGRSVATMTTQLRALLEAATRAAIDRFVLFSSISVYGDRTGTVFEDDMPGHHDSYGAAKHACEAMLRAWIREDVARGRRVVILRPGIVYGRGSDLWIERPAAALQAGIIGSLGPRGQGIAALIHVVDVAEATRAAVAALSGPGPGALTVNLVGPDTPTWSGYFAMLAERLPLVPLRATGPAERTTLRILAVPAKVLRRLGLPAPTALLLVPAAGEMLLFARAAHYDTTRAERMLGFRPAISLSDGLAEALPHKP